MKTMNHSKKPAGAPLARQMMQVVLGAALVMLLPLLAMQWTDEVVWTVSDFALMGTLLVGTGTAFVVGARMMRSTQQRIILGIALAVGLFLMWAELAVGIVGTPFAGS
jgi:hypothetical protein